MCDLLSTTDGPSTKETISQFIQDIKKTTSEIESISNSHKPPAVCLKPTPILNNLYLYLNWYYLWKENPKSLEKEEQRKKQWQGFLAQQEAKLLCVDNTIKEQEEELKKHYQQLQEQLKKL